MNWWHTFLTKIIYVDSDPKFEALVEPNPQLIFLSVVNTLYIFGYPISTATTNVVFDGPYMSYLSGLGFNASRVTKGNVCVVVTNIPFTKSRFMLSIYAYSLPGITKKLEAMIGIKLAYLQAERDLVIWANKKVLRKPILSKADKFMPKYYRWLNQFSDDNQIEYQM